METKLKYLNKRTVLVFMFIASVLIAVGCSQSAKPRAKEWTKDITVFAAASLTESVEEIANNFEHSESIRLNYAGSKTLRTQLENGAPADIFLSANEKHYKDLVEQDILLEGKMFVKNEMVLVLSKEGAEHIKGLEDLKEPMKLILAEEGVPAGNYARTVIENLDGLYGEGYSDAVMENLVSCESNIRQVMMKIVLGEGDAAICYRTDITEDVKDEVVVYEIPDEYNVTARYWMGLVNKETILEESKAFYDYFDQEESLAIFEKYGFITIDGE